MPLRAIGDSLTLELGTGWIPELSNSQLLATPILDSTDEDKSSSSEEEGSAEWEDESETEIGLNRATPFENVPH